MRGAVVIGALAVATACGTGIDSGSDSGTGDSSDDHIVGLGMDAGTDGPATDSSLEACAFTYVTTASKSIAGLTDYCCQTRGCSQFATGSCQGSWACAGLDGGPPTSTCGTGWKQTGEDVDAGDSFWCCN